MECFAPFSPPPLWLQGFGWGFLAWDIDKALRPGQIGQRRDGAALGGWTLTRQGREGVLFLITKVAKTTTKRSKGYKTRYIEDDRRSGEEKIENAGMWTPTR